MKQAVIRSTWMEGYGYRLDCSPYLGGALETKVLLEKLPLRKDDLRDVTTGIYHAGRESRHWVDSPKYGVPFISSSDLQKADLSDLPFISKKQVERTPLFIIKHGYTLITRSGTIGNMAYARQDMDGMACSEHVLRIVPNTEKIPSGYLFAYLSSKFGVPLVVSGTYGSIIQGLEPEHVAGLPVPRLGDSLEYEVHSLVEEAGELRKRASEEFRDAVADLEKAAGLPPSGEIQKSSHSLAVEVQSSELEGRLDTNFHRSYHYDAVRPYKSGGVKGRTVARAANSIVEPTRFKRIEHNNAMGVPFFGTGNLGDIDPEPLYRIAPFRDIDAYRVDERSVLVPRSGQIYGIIGRAFQPIGLVLKSAVTEDAIRVTCETPEQAGYIFLALRSECGLRQLKARCFGGSIPHLDVTHIGRVLIPDLGPKKERELGERASRVAKLRSLAIEKETRARNLAEISIEAAGKE